MTRKFQFPDRFNPSSSYGASLLCQCITEFWARRGYKVTVHRFQLYEDGPWGIRSNLVDGLPVARRG